MPLMRPLDPAFPIDRQIALETGPVVLVNVFTLDAEDEQSFLKTWQDDAAFMKRQPGFISTQLHRAVGDSPTYLNYAVWESTRISAPLSPTRNSAQRSPPTPHPQSQARICSRRSRCPVFASRSCAPPTQLSCPGLTGASSTPRPLRLKHNCLWNTGSPDQVGR